MLIQTAEQRLKEKQSTVKGLLVGESGIGKTTQLLTFDPKTTLFVNLEAGGIAVKDWKGDETTAKSWEELKDFACIIGGYNNYYADSEDYSKAHYDKAKAKHPTFDPSKYKTLFIDSLTEASRICRRYAMRNSVTKNGKPDNRQAYGLLGSEMIDWLQQLQKNTSCSVWFVSIMEYIKDEDSPANTGWKLQLDGSKVARELGGIVDQVVTYTQVKNDKNEMQRVFVTKTDNPYRFPAKDREGSLSLYEAPNLGALTQKLINAKAPKPASTEQKNAQ